MTQLEIDGHQPTNAELQSAVLDNYGHFTAMQVRASQVRGLDLHLARLTSAHKELFGANLDAELVRAHIRHALGAVPADASVRVLVRQPQDVPVIMVTVRPPGQLPSGPWRLRSVPYLRTVPHLKRVADFGQAYFQRAVNRDGFDEALLTGQGGVISEGAVTNIGFFDGAVITWPDAPVLAGTTMQLLDRTMAQAGLSARRAPVRLSEISAYRAVFVCNARGIAPVGLLDAVTFEVDADLMDRLQASYEAAGWDRI